MKRHTLHPTVVVQHIVRKYEGTGVWPHIQEVLPRLLWELFALGDGLVLLRLITAKVKLDDGRFYKLRFDHTTHVIQLCPMKGNENLAPVAVFPNGTTQRAIWRALHPKATATVDAQVRQALKGKP